LAVLHVKIGFLGGSFDPVHFGHLLAAQDASSSTGSTDCHRARGPGAPEAEPTSSPAEDRLAMLRAATEWDTRFEVSDFELCKGGISYTIDSARHFRALYPDDELFWVIGGDQLPQLHLWKDIGELAKLVEFIFLERPGYPVKAAPEHPRARLHRCDGHLLAISSTELRDRTPRAVARLFRPHKAIVYIRDKGPVSGRAVP
jgi:nicotinate-nucleotide adenylyltransferase